MAIGLEMAKPMQLLGQRIYSIIIILFIYTGFSLPQLQSNSIFLLYIKQTLRREQTRKQMRIVPQERTQTTRKRIVDIENQTRNHISQHNII